MHDLSKFLSLKKYPCKINIVEIKNQLLPNTIHILHTLCLYPLDTQVIFAVKQKLHKRRLLEFLDLYLILIVFKMGFLLISIKDNVELYKTYSI